MRRAKNGVIIIGTDLGYGNAKSSGSITRSSVDVYENKPIFTDNVLIYNGKYYSFGERHKPFIEDKSTDDDFYMLNMIAMAKELYLSRIYNANVHIATGLPLTWVRGQRENFRKYLLRNRELTFRYENKEFYIRLVGCSIYPQGYPAIIDQAGKLTGVNMLADIGNGTLNIMYIKDRQPVESLCWTEKLGVNQCVIRINKAVMDRFYRVLPDGIAEDFLRNGRASINKAYCDIFRKEAEKYVSDIFSVLAGHEYDPNTMRLFIVGGGGCIVEKFGTYDKRNVTIINNINAAAQGFEYLAEKQLNSKEKGDGRT